MWGRFDIELNAERPCIDLCATAIFEKNNL